MKQINVTRKVCQPGSISIDWCKNDGCSNVNWIEYTMRLITLETMQADFLLDLVGSSWDIHVL